MLITDLGFGVKEIWFAGEPFDVPCRRVIFRACKKHVESDFTCTEFPTLTLDLSNGLDEIMAGMDRKSCRYEVKRAYRDGVVFRRNEDYGKFFELNRSFRRQKGLKGHASLKYLWAHCTLFTAYVGDKLVAGQAYVEDGQNIRWLLGASTRLESSDVLVGCANRALIWEAIKYAKDKGIKEFDFGGVNPKLESVSSFKRSFGGVDVVHYTYMKTYSPLYKMAEKVYGKFY